MDYEVIWTDEALCDVEEIAKYIKKDSFFYASSVVTKIMTQQASLSHFRLLDGSSPKKMMNW